MSLYFNTVGNICFANTLQVVSNYNLNMACERYKQNKIHLELKIYIKLYKIRIVGYKLEGK